MKTETKAIKYFKTTEEEREIINKLQFPYSVDFYQGSSYLSCEEDILLDKLKNRLFNYYFDID